MDHFQTFNDIKIVDIDSSSIEKQFSVRIKNDNIDNIPLFFPKITETSCSCDKCSFKVSLENLQIYDIKSDQDDDDDLLICSFCRNKINECCSNCMPSNELHDDDCQEKANQPQERVIYDSENYPKYCSLDECVNCRSIHCSEYCSDHCFENCSDIHLNTTVTEKKSCIVIKSISCDHKFHFCCLKNWLPEKSICPLCATEWKYKNVSDTKIIIHHQDMVAEFDSDDDLMNKIAEKFHLDITKYSLTKNKNYVDEIKPGRYALCTFDAHNGFNTFKLEFKFGETVQSLLVKYSTSIKELQEMVASLFGMLKGQFKLLFENMELCSDFDNLNLFNLNIGPNSSVIVKNCITTEYVISMEEKFVILYPNCPEVSDTIQNVITANIAWLPYPFIKDVCRQELSCFLSSLYILLKKVNMDDDQINRICNKFGNYMTEYKFDPMQIDLAKSSLQNLLKLENFSNKNRMILVCTFYELIVRIQKESGIEKNQNVLLNSNVICNLLFIQDSEKVNWQYAVNLVKLHKAFNIFSPLVLRNSQPPLLTMNDKLNINVFTGNGKTNTLPIILFDPLTGNENEVDAAELGKKVAEKGDLLIIDDRIYDEGIMICIDTSNSMGSCSDFEEDLIAKRNREACIETEFYKILQIPRKKVPETEDIRNLKNTIIWFLTHPNFEDWASRYDILDDIICLEQHDNIEIATMLSKYISIFGKLLKKEPVNIDNTSYSYLGNKKDATVSNTNTIVEKYKMEPDPEYKCPLSGKLMHEPVTAKDGNTYEKSEITQWLQSNKISPITREKMSSSLLIPNKTIKSLIDKWRKDNIIESTDHKENTITIDLPEPWTKTTFVFDCMTNVWDLQYHIYNVTGLSHLDYALRIKNRYIHLDSNEFIKNIKGEINFIKLQQKNTKFTFEVQDTGTFTSVNLPDNYTCKNLIYKQKMCKYHKCAFWINLVDDGDGFVRGQQLPTSTKLHMIDDSKLHQRKCKLFHKNISNTSYLTRLDVVKKLFDSFVNRSIAYSFNTSIGLMSFSNENKLECDITPYYESFREKMEDLTEKGSTAMYKALKDAATRLIAWKKADLEKRGNAKLRVVCLSDGKNTELQSKTEVEYIFMGNNIVLDCIVIGQEFDSFLGILAKKTGGYVFNPSSIKYALDIMELETMISSQNRDKCMTFTGVINEKYLPPFKKPPQLMDKKTMDICHAVLKLDDANKIIKKQLTEILKNPHPDIDVYINENDFYFWKIIIKGPDSTPYKDGSWLIYVHFPTTYPAVPPNIRFVTPIKHCNVNSYGRICHSILDRSYTRNTKISMILQCIYGLLLNPDVTDPLDTNLAQLYYEANGQYEAQIMEWVNKHALKTRDQWRKELI